MSTDSILYEFSIYPFDTDTVFQEGLQSIVSSAHGKSTQELESIISQAKAFYFARATGHRVTWESYLEWKQTHPSSLRLPSAPADPPAAEDTANTRAKREEPKPLTLQQITELINTGQTHLIPNNKVIPEALNCDAPSESTRPARKKPWETGEATRPSDSGELGVLEGNH